jgi:hypothetical protein
MSESRKLQSSIGDSQVAIYLSFQPELVKRA